jgi:hypothetical protein
MQIDAHTHILSLAQDAEFTTEYGREGSSGRTSLSATIPASTRS